MGFLSRFFCPPSRSKFAELFLRALKEAGDRRTAAFDAGEFQIKFTNEGEAAGVANLHNLYATYCRLDRQDRVKWLKQTCLGLAREVDIPDDFEDARHDLYPALKSRAFLEVFHWNALTEREVELVAVPVSEHLVACLVYDLPHTINFITTEQLNQWGVSQYEVFEAARQNLDEKSGMLMSIGDKVHILECGDSYDATRLLKKDKLRDLKVEGDLVAVPVNRDCLLLTGSDDAPGLSIVADLVEMKLGEPRPICPIPVRLVGDEWETWFPEPSHAAYQKFRRFACQFLGGDYNDQKEYLDKKHEADGTDIFVATYNAVQQEDGQVRSYSAWTKGVPSWLPKTDDICFFDPDTKKQGAVAWDRVEAELGVLMSPLDIYPPRWTVDGFPTTEQLDRLLGSVAS